MEYSEIIKQVWRDDPTGIFRAVYSAVVIYTASFLRLGRVFKIIRRRGRKSMITDDQNILIADYYKQVERSMLAYELDDKPGYMDGMSIFEDMTEVVSYGIDGSPFIIGQVDGEVHVVIRGSVSTANWVNNVNTSMQWSDKLKSMVHDGYFEIARDISISVRDYMDTYGIQNKKVELYGHSMGGALAVIAGMFIDIAGYTVKNIVSIGGPKALQADYGELPVTHIINSRDPVPFLPVWSPFTPYRHQGKRLLIDEEGKLSLYMDNWRTDVATSMLSNSSTVEVSTHSEYLNHFKPQVTL